MNKSNMSKYSVSPSAGLLIYFLFLLGGMICGFLLTASFSIMILGTDIRFAQQVMENITDYPAYFHHLMAINVFTLIVMLLLPSLLFLKIFDVKIEGYALNQDKNVEYGVLLVLAGLLVFTVQPIVSWSGQLNKMVVLPEALHYLEVLAAETDAKYEQMFSIISDMTTNRDLILLVLFICVAPAVIEELVFRGVIQNLLGLIFSNKHLAIWAAAFLFSLMHMSLYGFLPRMILGALLGYVYLYSGKFIISVFVHFVNNLLVVLVLFYAPAQEKSLENPPLMFSMVGTVVFLCIGYYFIHVSKRKIMHE